MVGCCPPSLSLSYFFRVSNTTQHKGYRICVIEQRPSCTKGEEVGRRDDGEDGERDLVFENC